MCVFVHIHACKRAFGQATRHFKRATHARAHACLFLTFSIPNFRQTLYTGRTKKNVVSTRQQIRISKRCKLGTCARCDTVSRHGFLACLSSANVGVLPRNCCMLQHSSLRHEQTVEHLDGNKADTLMAVMHIPCSHTPTENTSKNQDWQEMQSRHVHIQ